MKAESKSPEITKRALEVFSEIGLYNEAQYEEYKAVYQNHENLMAEKEGKTARTLSRDYIEGEIAADLMCETMTSEDMLEMFVGKLSANDRNVILDFFKRVLDGFKKAFGKENAFTKQFADVVAEFEGAIKGKSDKKSSTEVEVRNAVSGNLSITQKAIKALQLIGPKSINKFTSDDIKISEPFARSMWKTLGTKSPFFRSWFGDWRANDKNTEIKIATIPEYIATNEARKKNRGFVRNTDTEWDINISRQGETNTISHSGKNKLSEFGLSGIRELIENAVLLDCEVHEHHNNNAVNDYVSFDHKLYALGKSTNGSIALYKITVEEYFQSKTEPENKRFHNLRYIEKVADVGGRTFESSRSGGSTDDNSATMYSISDLFSLVKTYDKEFSPKEPSKVANADGTPKIMYHGSPEQFTIFDKKKAKSSGAYGRGFYFTDSDSHARQYGNIYAVYLDVKNPLKQGDTKVTERQIRNFLETVAKNEDYSIENYGTYDVSEIMKTIESRDAFAVIQDVNATAIGDMVEAVKLWNEVNGTNFDGIAVPTETVVFEPTQIKSATDNIGTFDKNNPDIRYALSGDGVDNEGDSGYNRDDYELLSRPNYGVEWARGILTDAEIKQFYSNIAELQKLNFKFPKAGDGSYIFETDKSLILTDGDWVKPKIKYVFSIKDNKSSSEIKEFLYGWIKESFEPNATKSSFEETVHLANIIFGDGSATFGAFEDNKEIFSKQDRRREGTDSRETDSGIARNGENRIKRRDTEYLELAKEPEKNEERWALSDNGIYSLEEMMRDRNTAKITSVPLTALR